MRVVIVDILGLSYDGSTLTKRGLGGSESAVILMSKELSKIGFDVTVINSCKDSQATPGVYDGVTYVDHSEVGEEIKEPFDIAIVSRSTKPFLSDHPYVGLVMSAQYRVVWMHDTFCDGDEYIEPLVTGGFVHQIFTLSDFHTNYVMNNDHGQRKRMYEVVKHKFWQTRNGAVRWIDEVDLSKKDSDLFVYNASATKGLIPLLKNIWPEVKKQIPTAKLKCIGGFYRFRDNAEPDEQEKTVRQLMQDETIKSLDVEFTGVIPQYEIAEILANASFMLYPPAFPETFGISSLESLLYKTPIITSNFGALEETALTEACYKINYPAVPNGMFPHINEQEQTKSFVDMTVRAYNDKYLLQQKQNTCGVINDVYGWDSVALEWKQHFYRVFGKFLDVSEYRRVTEITDKVNRVFNRRILNKETTMRYSSYGKQRRIVIISPFYNAEKYLENHVRSVATQDYDNYIHVLIDDNSTDNGVALIEKVMSEMSEDIRSRTFLQKNKRNMGAIQNQIDVINNYVKYDDIVMLLDGDDWLTPNNTILHYYNSLYNNGYDFSYGSMWSLADNIPLVAQDYPSKVKSEKSYRQHKFNWGIPYTHLRTFSGEIALDLDEDVFKDENDNWMMAGADNPLFYETIERSYNPVAVKEIVAVYNDKNPLNDYKIRSEEQNRNANMVIYT